MTFLNPGSQEGEMDLRDLVNNSNPAVIGQLPQRSTTNEIFDF